MFEEWLYKHVTLRLHKHTKLFNFLRFLYRLFYKNTFLNKEYRIRQWVKNNNKFIRKNNLLPVFFDDKTAYFQSGNLRFFYNPLIENTGAPKFKNDSWEENISSYMQNYVKSMRGTAVVFDVGANIGMHSLILAEKFPKSIIYSFEPIKETFNFLKKNVEINSLVNMNPHNLAVSNKVGKLLMTGDEGTGNHIIKTKQRNTTAVNTITLDRFVKEKKVTRIDLMKIDVEGAELMVLKGGLETIKKFKPVMVIEIFENWTDRYDYKPKEIFDLLLSLGYSYRLVESNLARGSIKNITKELEKNQNFIFEPKKI